MPEKPRRIQRKRTKGWKMPPNTVSVTRPGKFGNPFLIRDFVSRKYCIDFYRNHLERLNRESQGEIYRIIRDELRGHNLACFCELSELCHADILLEIANKE